MAQSAAGARNRNGVRVRRIAEEAAAASCSYSQAAESNQQKQAARDTAGTELATNLAHSEERKQQQSVVNFRSTLGWFETGLRFRSSNDHRRGRRSNARNVRSLANEIVAPGGSPVTESVQER